MLLYLEGQAKKMYQVEGIYGDVYCRFIWENMQLWKMGIMLSSMCTCYKCTRAWGEKVETQVDSCYHAYASTYFESL